jgi:hypothetical protein
MDMFDNALLKGGQFEKGRYKRTTEKEHINKNAKR